MVIDVEESFCLDRNQLAEAPPPKWWDGNDVNSELDYEQDYDPYDDDD